MKNFEIHDKLIQEAVKKWPMGIFYRGKLSGKEIEAIKCECDVHLRSDGDETIYYILQKERKRRKKARSDSISTQTGYIKNLDAFRKFCTHQKQCDTCKCFVFNIDCFDVWMAELK